MALGPARLDTGRLHAAVDTVDTEGALLHNPVHPDRDIGVFIFFAGEFLGDKRAGLVGAGDHAITAANAPVLVDEDYTVLADEGGRHGAYMGAWRMLTMKTHGWHEPLLGVLDPLAA